MKDTPIPIPLTKLRPHPKNPRIVPRTDVIEQIAAQVREHGFDSAYAIMVRPLNGYFEILSGHNRKAGADLAGNVDAIPAWVREMNDDDAYMALVLSNAQGELTALEIGLHARHSHLSQEAYAKTLSLSQSSISKRITAAEVAEACSSTSVLSDLAQHWRHLAEVHRARSWLWSALVGAVIRDELTQDDTRDLVRSLKGAPKPQWGFDWPGIGERLVAGRMVLDDVQEMLTMFEHFRKLTDKRPDLQQEVERELAEHKVRSPAELNRVLHPRMRLFEEQQAAKARAHRLAAQEEAVELFNVVSLEKWKELDAATRAILLDRRKLPKDATFNKQDSDSIEWAQWSWNPITGCEHNCPYCYARDIATLGNTARAFPHGFSPAFEPRRLNAPRNMRVPKQATKDGRYRNVFCCSMADMFGRWVPAEWIEAVLGAIRDAPQWTFLLLTKFPQRAAEFDIPRNVWMGTTVDLQARVKNAEAAFAKIKASVKWLSIEPMLEPIHFENIKLFDWIVIGGASSSSQTPEWKPPFDWVADLWMRAKAVGVRVYMKDNLLGNRVLELPSNLPIELDYPQRAPAVFNYLKQRPAAGHAAPIPQAAAADAEEPQLLFGD